METDVKAEEKQRCEAAHEFVIGKISQVTEEKFCGRNPGDCLDSKILLNIEEAKGDYTRTPENSL